MSHFIIVAAIVLATVEVVIAAPKRQSTQIPELNIVRDIDGQRTIVEPAEEDKADYDKWMTRCYGPQQKPKTNEKWAWPWTHKNSLRAIGKGLEEKLKELLTRNPPMELSEYEQFVNTKADEFRKLRERSMELPLSKISASVFECCEILHQNTRIYKTFLEKVAMAQIQQTSSPNTANT